MRISWIKERFEKGEFDTQYCKTDLMLADGFTKPKLGEKFSDFCNSIGVKPKSDASSTSKERVRSVEVNRESTIAHDQIEDSRIHE